MTPADSAGQLLITHELSVESSRLSLRLHRLLGHPLVEAFDVHEPHTTLEVVSPQRRRDTPAVSPRPDGLTGTQSRVGDS